MRCDDCPLEALYCGYPANKYDIDQAIVVAESPETVIEMLKTSLEEMHGEGQEAMWGNFDVTIKEVSLEEPKIILKMFCAG